MAEKFIRNLALFLCVFSLGAVSAMGQTDLGAATYPTSGSPASMSNGSGVTNQDVVTGITIDDSSTLGWTLTVSSTNGPSTQPRLLNSVNSSTIDYDLKINNISGTLGTGLTVSPPANTTLVFSGGSTAIETTGTASSSTINYRFDLRMTIADASTVGKLAGTYVDTLSLLLASKD